MISATPIFIRLRTWFPHARRIIFYAGGFAAFAGRFGLLRPPPASLTGFVTLYQDLDSRLSWPGYPRLSSCHAAKTLDARDKRGHDGFG
jgi:hypothetical protein